MRVGDQVRRYRDLPYEDDQYRTYRSHHGPTGVIFSLKTIELDKYGDTYERIEEAMVRWEDGTVESIRRRDETPDQHGEEVYEVIDEVTPLLYVNVYLEDRCYGGPEEGGWWYDAQWPEESECVYCKTEAEAERVLEEKQVWCDRENCERRSDIGSVRSEGRYLVVREAWPAERSPSRRPHYC